LLAAAMGMRAEPRVRGVTHDRRRARDLLADPVEHPPLDPGHRRGPPRLVTRKHHLAAGEVCSKLHAPSYSAERGCRPEHAVRACACSLGARASRRFAALHAGTPGTRLAGLRGPKGEIMIARKIIVAAGCGMLWLGCTEPPSETQEIIDNLVEAGFPPNDIMVVNGVVYVGRDAEVSLAASREMIRVANSSKEQYRTTNLISASLSKICINGSTFTGAFSTALDLAIQNYDEQPLTFAMARTQ